MFKQSDQLLLAKSGQPALNQPFWMGVTNAQSRGCRFAERFPNSLQIAASNFSQNRVDEPSRRLEPGPLDELDRFVDGCAPWHSLKEQELIRAKPKSRQ